MSTVIIGIEAASSNISHLWNLLLEIIQVSECGTVILSSKQSIVKDDIGLILILDNHIIKFVSQSGLATGIL